MDTVSDRSFAKGNFKSFLGLFSPIQEIMSFSQLSCLGLSCTFRSCWELKSPKSPVYDVQQIKTLDTPWTTCITLVNRLQISRELKNTSNSYFILLWWFATRLDLICKWFAVICEWFGSDAGDKFGLVQDATVASWAWLHVETATTQY